MCAFVAFLFFVLLCVSTLLGVSYMCLLSVLRFCFVLWLSGLCVGFLAVCDFLLFCGYEGNSFFSYWIFRVFCSGVLRVGVCCTVPH